MKPITLFVLLAFSTSVFCQQNTPAINTDYLKKSKNQKRIALIMLGGGAALTLTALLIPKGEVTHSGFLGDDYENDGIKNSFGSTGVLAMLGSIPLFIASSKNKKKAAAIGFRMNELPVARQNGLAYQSTPGLSMKRNLPFHSIPSITVKIPL